MTPANPRLAPNIVLRNRLGERSSAALLKVVEQFHVETSERYRIRDTSGDGVPDTFCNIFASDVMGALDVALPHEIDGFGDPAAPLKGHELSANATVAWLRMHGPRFGWRAATELVAREAALAGRPAVVTYDPGPGRIGHIAVLVPGPITTIAQAGRQNFSYGPLIKGFGSLIPKCEFWIND